MTTARALAERIVARAAEIMGAKDLVPVTFAHLDSCFYAGEAHIDFARYMLENGAAFAVPTWSNNGVVSLEQPGLKDAADPQVQSARELMKLYMQLGARPTFTCAPYHLPGGPERGNHIVVGESNAVTFYNSVTGARTNKYGDYLDVACAILGKAPRAGLHTEEGRSAEVLFSLRSIPAALLRNDIAGHLIGHSIGRRANARVIAIEGVPGKMDEAGLKAISSAVAASGGVELWHNVGHSPEAPEAAAVMKSKRHEALALDDLLNARADLSTARDGPLDAVALGTPHFSLAECEAFAAALDGRKVRPGLPVFVTMGRFTRDLAVESGIATSLTTAGVSLVTDICTYYSPAIRGLKGRVMTNAAKWAYYAPGMLPVEVCFGSLRECAESAVRGEVWRDAALWSARA